MKRLPAAAGALALVAGCAQLPNAQPPFAVKRARPLCEWPNVPRYHGGDPNAAASFACAP